MSLLPPSSLRSTSLATRSVSLAESILSIKLRFNNATVRKQKPRRSRRTLARRSRRRDFFAAVVVYHRVAIQLPYDVTCEHCSLLQLIEA